VGGGAEGDGAARALVGGNLHWVGERIGLLRGWGKGSFF
jgi:hypothetical protein